MQTDRTLLERAYFYLLLWVAQDEDIGGGYLADHKATKELLLTLLAEIKDHIR